MAAPYHSAIARSLTGWLYELWSLFLFLQSKELFLYRLRSKLLVYKREIKYEALFLRQTILFKFAYKLF